MNMNEEIYMNDSQVSKHCENKELLKDLDLGELLKVKKLMNDIKIRK
jgi:hypothetical protein